MPITITITDAVRLSARERQATIDYLQSLGQPSTTTVTSAPPPAKVTESTPPIEIPDIKEIVVDGLSYYLDSKGVPWSPMIHSRTRSREADGTWKRQKRIDPRFAKKTLDELYARIKGENSTQAPPPVPVAPPPHNLNDLVVRITAAIAAGKITRVQVNAALNDVGIASLPLLGTRPELIPAVAESLKEFLS